MRKVIQKNIYRDELDNIAFIKVTNQINKFFYRKYGTNVRFAKALFVKHPECISIGNNVSIRSGIRLEPITEWRGKKYNPHIVIGNHVAIEQNVHIACAKMVKIEDGVLISSNVFITDCAHSYKDVKKRVLQQHLIVTETVIGKDSFVGSGAKILAGVKIGKHCVIGANSVVNHDVPDYSVVAGTPAKIIKRYDFEKKEWIRLQERT